MAARVVLWLAVAAAAAATAAAPAAAAAAPAAGGGHFRVVTDGVWREDAGAGDPGRGFNAAVRGPDGVSVAVSRSDGEVVRLAGSPLAASARRRLPAGETVFFGFELLGRLYFFTGSSSAWMLDAGSLDLHARVNLTRAVPPGWMGAAHVDRGPSASLSSAYLTGKASVVRLGFDGRTGEPAASGSAALPGGGVPLFLTRAGPKGRLYVTAERDRTEGVLHELEAGPSSMRVVRSLALGAAGWPFAATGSAPGGADDVYVLSANRTVDVDVDGWRVRGTVESRGCVSSELACFDRAAGVGFVLCGDAWQAWHYPAEGGAPRSLGPLQGGPPADAGARHSCALADGSLVHLAYASGGRSVVVTAKYAA